VTFTCASIEKTLRFSFPLKNGVELKHPDDTFDPGNFEIEVRFLGTSSITSISDHFPLIYNKTDQCAWNLPYVNFATLSRFSIHEDAFVWLPM